MRLNLFFLFFFLLSLFSLLTSPPSFASCFNPAGNAGDTRYNGGYRVEQYCNGGNWVSTGPVGNTTTGLAGWWKFDETSGASAADSSGNNNTGTLTNGPTWTTSGMNNGALVFLGQVGANDTYVDAGNPASLQITGSVTMTAWIYMTSENCCDDDDSIIKKANSGGFGLKGSQDCTGTNPGDNLVLDIENGAAITERCSSTVLAHNTWYFVAGVYNAAALTMDVYINGVLDDGTWFYTGGASTVPSSTTNTPAHLTIGDSYNDAGQYNPFHGTIDDARVYNRALSAADVYTLYTSTGGSYPTGIASAPAQATGTACAIAGSGALYCWGHNSNGEAGLGNTSQYTTPQQVGAATNQWSSISQGDPGYNPSACGIDAGNLYCWGQNQYGEAGLGNTTPYTTPQQVTSPSTTWSAVRTGGYDSCGITTAGKLYCWGRNANGEAGLGNTTPYTTPQQVGADTTWTAISTLASSTCGIDAGKLYCWGQDNQGELGCGGCGEQHSPVQVGSDTTWTAISQGLMTTCGIDAGKLYCWGNGNNGVLGLGNTTQYTTPQRVGADTTWTAVSTNNDNSDDPGTCGIDAGNLYCWGYNQYGELGLGNTTQYTTPQRVGTDTTWTSVSYGGYDTCGIDASKLYCWGNNHWGEDGTDNGTQYTTPQLVALDGGGCASPVGYTGHMMYNADYHVAQYCDGANWIPMGPVPGAGGAGCSNPAGGESDIRYNGDLHALQYCDGTNWISAGGTATATTNGLVGWWNFDESSGTSAADSSGNNNTGTLTNSPTWTTSGKINGALSLTAASSQYVSIADAASLRIAGSWTVSAWVKPTTLPANTNTGRLIVRDAGTGTFNYALSVDNNYACGTLAWRVHFNNSSGTMYDACYATAISTGTWYLVTGVWDSSTSNLYMYVNGTLVMTQNKAGAVPISSAGGNVELGRDLSDPLYFDGTIDDARIYNRALSAAEIWSLYNGGP